MSFFLPFLRRPDEHPGLPLLLLPGHRQLWPVSDHVPPSLCLQGGPRPGQRVLVQLEEPGSPCGALAHVLRSFSLFSTLVLSPLVSCDGVCGETGGGSLCFPHHLGRFSLPRYTVLQFNIKKIPVHGNAPSILVLELIPER